MCAVCACNGVLAVRRQEVDFFLLMGVTITTILPTISESSVLSYRVPHYKHHGCTNVKIWKFAESLKNADRKDTGRI